MRARKLRNSLEIAKLKTYDDFYTRLGSRYGEKNIYKLVKMGERNKELYSSL